MSFQRPPRLPALVATVFLILVTVACSAGGTTPPGAAETAATSASVPPGALLAAQPVYAAERSDPPTPTATRRALALTATPTNTPEPPTATPDGPTPIATPSPRPEGTPPRVGLQVGHWKSNELPEELARLRTSTGARWGDVTEADLNYDIAVRVQALLEAEGVVVDLLPATVPPAYDADAFVAIHADGSSGSAPRGWKLATPWRASRAAIALMEGIHSTYGQATGLPEDVGGVTVNMRGYYAFNYRRHEHAIARTTPGIIVEMGFMTNAADREVMFNQPDRVARGIADGILLYLRQRDPNDGAALLPPEFPSVRTGPNGAVMRTAPRDDAGVLRNLEPDERVFIIGREGDWYQIFARNTPGSSGWIRMDQVVESQSSGPPPEPTSSNP
ncbi:MAG: SH3 domain-containing protein [Oscillochloris sp.]|nr:SH3 domain-containing protein [Oscillochloris sp.]